MYYVCLEPTYFFGTSKKQRGGTVHTRYYFQLYWYVVIHYVLTRLDFGLRANAKKWSRAQIYFLYKHCRVHTGERMYYGANEKLGTGYILRGPRVWTVCESSVEAPSSDHRLRDTPHNKREPNAGALTKISLNKNVSHHDLYVTREELWKWKQKEPYESNADLEPTHTLSRTHLARAMWYKNHCVNKPVREGHQRSRTQRQRLYKRILV